MKKLLNAMMAVLLAGTFSVQAQSTEQKLAENQSQIALADARSRIDKAIESPTVMTAIMKHLSAEDQKQSLADVNKAISDMPASVEEKVAKFLNVNHAALKGAAKGNLATLVAEVYATVPPEALTIINERFAADLFSRSADSAHTYTDAQFTEIALSLMEKVNERCEETDNASPRCAFAILMLVRASGGSPADLTDKLIDTLKHEEAKELARSEWIPAALGTDDRQQDYESILASADAGRRPDYDFVLVIAGPQFADSMLFDLSGRNTNPLANSRTRTPVFDAIQNPLRHQEPILGADLADRPDIQPQKGGDVNVKPDVTPTPEPEPEPEPRPYNWQRIS